MTANDGVQEITVTAQRDGYTLKPGLPAPSAAIADFLQCTATCSGQNLYVTSTSDSHGPTNPHTRGLAVDLTTSNPKTVMQCSPSCGAEYELNEYTDPSPNSTGGHLHFQLVPGLGGATGPYYSFPLPQPRLPIFPEDY